MNITLEVLIIIVLLINIMDDAGVETRNIVKTSRSHVTMIQ